MTYQGTVQNGVVVFEKGVGLPEGTVVTVVPKSDRSQPPTASGTPTIWNKLLDLAGTVEGLPADMAENHDHYLYGGSKKQ